MGLEFPTLAIDFDDRRMEDILWALGAYVSELERNDFRRLVRGRAEMNASIVPELIFGFGEPARSLHFIEALTEVVLVRGRWMLVVRRPNSKVD